MDGACGTNARNKKCISYFGNTISREQTISSLTQCQKNVMELIQRDSSMY